MDNVLFFDFEVSYNTKKIRDIGAIHKESEFHKSNLTDFLKFAEDSEYASGHNIFNHDLKYLYDQIGNHAFFKRQFIDTLFISALLFADKPYHKLVKDYRILDEGNLANDPLFDSKLAKQLLKDEIKRFGELSELLRNIYVQLLGNQKRFKGFFNLVNAVNPSLNIEQNIYDYFDGKICSTADLKPIIQYKPVELAYALALINADNDESIPPPWLIKTHPSINYNPFHNKLFMVLP